MEPALHTACVNTIKGLAMDAVQAANSGHPGMPLGMADAATVLFTKFLKFDPADPEWPDRDRFVLSAGHGSMLIYSLLHLCGYDVSLDDIKAFRQLHSKTPGHPEYGHTPGVETTTGPLGQGVANAVGMAMAERFLRERFGTDLVDHYTYAIAGDGCLMEGIAAEAAGLAGHLKLDRLVVLYDDNGITIDGSTDLAFTEDVAARFAAAHWDVTQVDGHDPRAVEEAIAAAKKTAQPSLICCRTTIGQGSPSYEGTSRTHGSPLGPEEVAATKSRIGLDPEQFFAVLPEAKQAFTGAASADAHAEWKARVAAHAKKDEFLAYLNGDVSGVEWPTFEVGSKLATRKASLAALKAAAVAAPWLVGGSADLAGSNGTKTGQPAWTPESFDGAVIHFGVREHAMGAVCNGMVLHGGTRPYNATFLVFHDYQRPAVRLSALMGAPVVYVYTHDSIFLGEDGPTHQPIASLLALRSLPGLNVWRPADAHETAECWRELLADQKHPAAIVLTRQGLPVMPAPPAGAVSKGGYVVRDGTDIVLIGTGSEVSLCLETADKLAADGVSARVVSLPNRERFWEQSLEYRKEVLAEGLPRVSVEAGVTLGWERYTGDNGDQVGIDTFGASAPAAQLAEHFGFTAEAVAARAKALL